MRILVVASYYKPAYVYGGPARSVPALCESLADLGNDITVFTTNANGAENMNVTTGVELCIDGVKVFYYNRSRILPRRYFFAPDLGRACRSRMSEFDILYICATWTYPLIPAARAAIANGVPYVVSPRGSFMRWSMQQKRLKKAIYFELIEKRLVDKADAVHCTSAIEKAQFERGASFRKLVLVPNGLAPKGFAGIAKSGRIRSQFGISMDALVTAYVGRLEKMKRLDLIIESFNTVAKKILNSFLLIVGVDEDESAASARTLVLDLGLKNKVFFLGHLNPNQLLDVYGDIDLLTLLSFGGENFGMVALEAMAAGVPVLVSKSVGLSDFVLDYEGGVVVDTEKDDVGNRWAELLKDPIRLGRMGRAARLLVADKFSSEAVGKQMCNALEEIVTSRRIAPHR